MELKNKLEFLENYFHNKKVLVAFSGGADSTLLAAIAAQHAKKVLLVTFNNGAFSSKFAHETQLLSSKLGLPHQYIQEDLLNNEIFIQNNSNRCYICRKTMYLKLIDLKNSQGWDIIVDGTNVTDLLEERPGVQVNHELNINMPLAEAALTNEEVRKVLYQMKLDYIPSTTCMATRLQFGEILTPEKLKKIENAEDIVQEVCGTQIIRVRVNADSAIIEAGKLESLLDVKILDKLNKKIKKLGYKKVMLNLSTYGESIMDKVVYKPCSSGENNLMIEIELPYHIDLSETIQKIKELGEIKYSPEIGVAMIVGMEEDVTIFEKGKLIIRGVKGQDKGDDVIGKILPLLRRSKIN